MAVSVTYVVRTGAWGPFTGEKLETYADSELAPCISDGSYNPKAKAAQTTSWGGFCQLTKDFAAWSCLQFHKINLGDSQALKQELCLLCSKH